MLYDKLVLFDKDNMAIENWQLEAVSECLLEPFSHILSHHPKYQHNLKAHAVP